uniref:Uncharacterized protein n=1 Tax=Nelumbo nucifera TaxID=4432 RepID=A0A822ZDL3_NELNU|nr:TPA_asm: hypothetical protein HUJ06_015872 [Nelumbo nucifera]
MLITHLVLNHFIQWQWHSAFVVSPFFYGSPPTRATNPLIQDARFGEEKLTSFAPVPIPTPSGLWARRWKMQ